MGTDCDCSQCKRNRGEVEKTRRVCPTCKKANCPKAWFHALRCTDNNEPGQIGVEE